MSLRMLTRTFSAKTSCPSWQAPEPYRRAGGRVPNGGSMACFLHACCTINCTFIPLTDIAMTKTARYRFRSFGKNTSLRSRPKIWLSGGLGKLLQLWKLNAKLLPLRGRRNRYDQQSDAPMNYLTLLISRNHWLENGCGSRRRKRRYGT